MSSEVGKRAAHGRALGFVLAGLLVGCSHSTPHYRNSSSARSSVQPSSPVGGHSPASGTVSFCVGTNSRFAAGEVVAVHIMRDGNDLAAPNITVPMRVTVTVSAGPIQVLIDATSRLSGVVQVGETLSGEFGSQCPSV